MKALSTHRSSRFNSGANCFEMLFFMLTVVGGFVGIACGWSHYGIWGGLLGLPIGAAAGYVSSIVLILPVFLLLWFDDSRRKSEAGTNKDRKE